MITIKRVNAQRQRTEVWNVLFAREFLVVARNDVGAIGDGPHDFLVLIEAFVHRSFQ